MSSVKFQIFVFCDDFTKVLLFRNFKRIQTFRKKSLVEEKKTSSVVSLFSKKKTSL